MMDMNQFIDPDKVQTWLPTGYVRNNPSILARIESDLIVGDPMHYLFTGCCGSGKTLLARALYDEIVRQLHAERWDGLDAIGFGTWATYNAQFRTARELYSAYLAALHSSADLDRINGTLDWPVVVLDDLGAEPDTTAARDFVGGLILRTYDKRGEYYRLLTIITTNLTGDEIRRIYGERVMDRIDEMFVVMAFEAVSFRQQQAQLIKG